MNTQIYEEACTWFVELRLGDVDDSVRRQFDAWIRTSPEHLRAYLEITEIWQDAPFVGNEGDLSIEALTAHAREKGNVVPLEMPASWVSGVSGQSPLGRSLAEEPHLPSLWASPEEASPRVVYTTPPLSSNAERAELTSLPLREEDPFGACSAEPADLARSQSERGTTSSVPPLPWKGEDKNKTPYPFSTLGEKVPKPDEASGARRADEASLANPGEGKVKLLAIAASLLLILAIGGASTWFITQRNAYATAIGEQRLITLEDGSTVHLNARSKIKIHFTEHQRSIALLEGQALFSVAKNPARPFIVDTGTTRIRAVGTQFDIYKKRSGTVVTVIEGRVAVARDSSEFRPRLEDPHLPAPRTPSSPLTRRGDNEAENSSSSSSPLASEQENIETLPHSLSALEGEEAKLPSDNPKGWLGFSRERKGVAKPGEALGEVLLAAGEQMIVTLAALPQPKKANIATATAWTQRHLIFDDSSLPEVIEEFNRYNIRQFTIVDPHLSEFHISGVYASTDPEFLLRFLRAQASIEINETDTEIQISRK